MKCLITEDDFTSRKLLQIHLSDFADCFVAVNGIEAVKAFHDAIAEQKPYDLICLDIMMPEMNGHDALKMIRRTEQANNIHGSDGVKVIMTTAMTDSKHIFSAFRGGCESYIIKPVRKERLLKELKNLGLIQTHVRS
ncbi:MAG: response regulator [Candidatus Brocadiia bacterium]|nr:MAG: response regulator [Candidatus Brocadiia bacterium]